MQGFHGSHIPASVLLLFGILQGLCMLADGNTETLYRAAGSSLDLFLKHPKDSVSNVDWLFNYIIFAEYTGSNVSSVPSWFSGRLKVDSNKIGVTVQDLQLQDSGKYVVMSDGHEEQLDTQVFNVYIQNPITNVTIEKNRMWLVSTNSCMINVRCEALGAESVSYRWSGYKDADGAQLNFSLSPAEEEVTLNCTAPNKVSTSSATERLNCTGAEPEASLSVLKMISSAVAASPYLLVTFILGVKCYRAHNQMNDQFAEG
ncbi:uncharacterized protein LOC134311763 [Trichomycterus rosablanca]|uniref:uncharacterized protein LOC134311763 n=1 Tax=Trichomycterus rosablanca TaxID=2290929 RepID=UPI002F360531